MVSERSVTDHMITGIPVQVTLDQLSAFNVKECLTVVSCFRSEEEQTDLRYVVLTNKYQLMTINVNEASSLTNLLCHRTQEGSSLHG